MAGDQHPGVLLRARDAYATYCAAAGGVNYQGSPCPTWDGLPEAIRGNWYAVALRAGALESLGVAIGRETQVPPNATVFSHLREPAAAPAVWRRYSGLEEP